jgi:hypothetical protein
VNPTVPQLLDQRGSESRQSQPLWPYLLVLALLLDLVELAWRKRHFDAPLAWIRRMLRRTGSREPEAARG